MANALNVRLINDVTSIAQGDNASTVILELLDNNRLIMPFLDGKTALINFISDRNEIQYQTTAPVFDSRIEFNVDAVLPHGKYNVEVRIEDEDASYVFPSSVNYMLTIHKSANDFYNVAVEVNGVEVIVHEIYQRLESENPGLLEHVDRKDNPHGTTKSQIGLENVDNVKQASKQEFDSHAQDSTIHVTESEKQSWNSKATQEDIDDAVEGLDFVSNQSFTGHVGNEDLHWQVGERGAIDQSIEDVEQQVNDTNVTLTNHINDKNNPHAVTSEQVNLKEITEETGYELPPIASLDDGLFNYDVFGVQNLFVCKSGLTAYAFMKTSSVDGLKLMEPNRETGKLERTRDFVFKDSLEINTFATVSTDYTSIVNVTDSKALLRLGNMHVKLNLIFNSNPANNISLASVSYPAGLNLKTILGEELYFPSMVVRVNGDVEHVLLKVVKGNLNNIYFERPTGITFNAGDRLVATLTIPLEYN